MDTGIKCEYGKSVRTGSEAYNICLKYLEEHEKRNKILYRISKDFLDDKILYVFLRKSHVDLFYDICIEKGSDAVKFYEGNKTYKDCRILVSTYSKIAEGFDQESVCENFDGQRIRIVVFCSSTKSFTRIIQTFGRAMRHSDPLLIDVVDGGTKMLVKHYNLREELYEKRKFIMEDY